jgi:ketosteroid isomerase-like protein
MEGAIMGVEQNASTVRQGYAAFSSGDMDALMALYQDDAVHIVPGSSRVSGAHKGKQSILGLYGNLFELSGGTFQVQLDHVLSDGGNRALAIHTSRMKKDGETVTQTEALLFSFVDGKVAEIQDFFGDIELNDRLFS